MMEAERSLHEIAERIEREGANESLIRSKQTCRIDTPGWRVDLSRENALYAAWLGIFRRAAQ
jgi:hypothetical protein